MDPVLILLGQLRRHQLQAQGRRYGRNGAGRVSSYHAQTAPLIAHYEWQSVLERVSAMGSITGIRARLAGIVGRVAA